MKELHFTRTGKMLVATEGPYRFQLWQIAGGIGWSAAIFEREGRRTAKLMGHFTSKAQAINWLAKYRKPETSHSRSGGVSGSGGRGGGNAGPRAGSGAGV